jgi:hypothetical protein
VASAETVRLLRWHAGLVEDAAAVEPSVVSASLDGGSSVDVAVTSLLGVLERLNHELNGATPSEISGGTDDVPRVAAYAVAEVTRMLRSSGHDADAWRVDTAWSAVLVGDIDDVVEHVEEERWAGGEG